MVRAIPKAEALLLSNSQATPLASFTASHDDRVTRVLAHLPEAVRATLTERQVDALRAALAAEAPRSDLRDLDVNVRAFRASYFLRVLWGTEQRRQNKADKAGHFKFGPTVGIGLMTVWLFVSLIAFAAAVAFYLAKSHVGIDLVPGHSFVGQCFGT